MDVDQTLSTRGFRPVVQSDPSCSAWSQDRGGGLLRYALALRF